VAALGTARLLLEDTATSFVTTAIFHRTTSFPTKTPRAVRVLFSGQFAGYHPSCGVCTTQRSRMVTETAAAVQAQISSRLLKIGTIIRDDGSAECVFAARGSVGP